MTSSTTGAAVLKFKNFIRRSFWQSLAGALWVLTLALQLLIVGLWFGCCLWLVMPAPDFYNTKD